MTITTKPGGITGTGGSINIDPADPAAPALPAPNDPPAPAPAPAPAPPPVVIDRHKSGWHEKAAQLKAKLANGARTLASQPVAPLNVMHQVGPSVANVHFHGNITEKVALQKDDALVTSNADRVAAAKNGRTWTKVGVVGDAGVTALMFGYDTGVKVSGVVDTASHPSFKSLGHLAVDQAKLLTMSFHPKEMANYAPGTEFSIARHTTTSQGARLSADQSVFALNMGIEMGAERTHDKASYAKDVLVRADKHLKVRIDKTTHTGYSAGAGLGVGWGVVDHDRRRDVGDFTNEKNHANIISAYVGASHHTTKDIAISGDFDMKTDAGQSAYKYLMDADPRKLSADPAGARDALQKFGVKVAYVDKVVENNTQASASLTSHNLFNVGSHSKLTNGTLFEVKSADGKVIDTMAMTEREYSRTRSGLLPRWVSGEERESMIRMGSVSVNGSSAQRAALVSLKVTDPKVDATETQEIANFASALGYKTDQRPTGSNGKGVMSVQVGLTEDGVAKLDAMKKEDFSRALENSYSAIYGRTVPWADQTQSQRNPSYRNEKYFDPPSVATRFSQAVADMENGLMTRSDVLRDYRLTTGRNFENDLNTLKSMKLIAEEFDRARGKSIEDRGPLLSTLGKLSSPDMRAAILTLRTVAGAGIVGFEYSGNGVNISAKPELPPLPTVAETAAKALNR